MARQRYRKEEKPIDRLILAIESMANRLETMQVAMDEIAEQLKYDANNRRRVIWKAATTTEGN